MKKRKRGRQGEGGGRRPTKGTHIEVATICPECGVTFSVQKARLIAAKRYGVCCSKECYGLHKSKYHDELHSADKKTRHADRHLRKMYDIPAVGEGGPTGLPGIDKYEETLAGQSGVCGICGRPPKEGKRFAVDHNHTTGVLRGLLCTGCNRHVLGVLEHFVDSGITLEKIKLYLLKFDPTNDLLKENSIGSN